MTSLKARQFVMPDDIPRLTHLKNEYRRAYGANQLTTEERQQFLLTLRDHDAEKDNRVIEHPENPGELIAHIWVWTQTSERAVFELTIHPGWQRQGLGTSLLNWAIGRAREMRVKTFDIQINVECLPQIKFVQKHGFRPLGTYLNMRLSPTVQLPEPVLPAGFMIKTYSEAQNLADYTQALIRGYGDLWGHSTTTTEEDEASALKNLDTEGVCLLYAPDGAIAGVGRAQLETQTNIQDGGQAYYIDVPGVVPEHRQPDLYRALLLRNLKWIRANMHESTAIIIDSWGDLDSTRNVFWEIGFEVIQHAIGYRYYLG